MNTKMDPATALKAAKKRQDEAIERARERESFQRLSESGQRYYTEEQIVKHRRSSAVRRKISDLRMDS